MVEFKSDITCHLVKVSAEDVDVTRSARVSTLGAGSQDSETDRALIRYLMRSRHGSCFEHSFFSFYVEAPIFVFREHMRHRVGVSYSESSARYRKLDPVFYIPATDRPLQQVGKAGNYVFESGTPQQVATARNVIANHSLVAFEKYEQMLEAGIAREVARSVLPVNIYSQAYVSMNPRSMMHFLSLRSSQHGAYPSYAQHEISLLADGYEAAFAHHMPITHGAYNDYGRVAP